MCGIFGLIGKNGDIHPSLKLLAHRGPDDEGIFSDGQVTLGFRRLSVIDLSSRGCQPMFNETKSISLVCNGEIYNYQELRKQLSKKHRFLSRTDAEVIIHGYEEWGLDKLLEKVNGMFALALYDQKKKIVFLARDRIGKKPLYYYTGDDWLAFASEAKAFFGLKDCRLRLSEENLNLWWGFPYYPDNQRTIFSHVFKVPPATYLRISSQDLKIKPVKYWSIDECSTESLDQPEAGLEKLLVDSVGRRLVADVPVGILLSGGLDSSLITAIASRFAADKVKTINISFKNSPIDESGFAELVASHCGTSHYNLLLNIQDLYGVFKKNISIFDDLSTVDGGLFSTFLLSSKIREKGIKVILVGEGADEVFGGYSWFRLAHFPFNAFPEFVRTELYYYAIMRVWNNFKFIKYPVILSRKLNEQKESYFRKVQRYEITYSLPNHYCMKLDKGSSAASVEARAPFLDYRIINFARGLSQNEMLKGCWYNPKAPTEKYLLRKIARKYLPEKICQRKKRGGMLPVNKILEEGLKNDSALILKNQLIVDFFGKSFLKSLINSRSNLTAAVWQREWILWKCLVFALWSKHFKLV